MFTFSKKINEGEGVCGLEFCLLTYLLFVLPNVQVLRTVLGTYKYYNNLSLLFPSPKCTSFSLATGKPHFQIQSLTEASWKTTELVFFGGGGRCIEGRTHIWTDT